MYFLCAHRGFASFCPHFNSAKAASYPPQFTEREAENQLPREGGAGQEVWPRALALAHQALPPRSVCSSKFQLPSMAPRPAGPGLSPCSLMSHSSPMYALASSSARLLVHTFMAGHRLLPWRETPFSSQSQLCSGSFCLSLRTKLPAVVLLRKPPWPDRPWVGTACLPLSPPCPFSSASTAVCWGLAGSLL